MSSSTNEGCMTTRRKFLAHAFAGALVAATPIHGVKSAGHQHSASVDPGQPGAASHSIAPRMGSAIRRDETLLRYGGDGAGFDMTWTSDERQIISVIDGPGWPANPGNYRYYNSRLFNLHGEPRHAR